MLAQKTSHTFLQQVVQELINHRQNALHTFKVNCSESRRLYDTICWALLNFLPAKLEFFKNLYVFDARAGHLLYPVGLKIAFLYVARFDFDFWPMPKNVLDMLLQAFSCHSAIGTSSSLLLKSISTSKFLGWPIHVTRVLVSNDRMCVSAGDTCSKLLPTYEYNRQFLIDTDVCQQPWTTC